LLDVQGLVHYAVKFASFICELCFACYLDLLSALAVFPNFGDIIVVLCDFSASTQLQ